MLESAVSLCHFAVGSYASSYGTSLLLSSFSLHICIVGRLKIPKDALEPTIRRHVENMQCAYAY